MINLDDLKIGNYLLDNSDRICKVTEIGLELTSSIVGEPFKAPAIQGGITSLPHKEIPVTPEILDEFGFTVAMNKNITFWYINRTDYHLKLTKTCFEIYLDELDTKVIFSGTGLHELQNIWYYLTKMKLKFN